MTEKSSYGMQQVRDAAPSDATQVEQPGRSAAVGRRLGAWHYPAVSVLVLATVLVAVVMATAGLGWLGSRHANGSPMDAGITGGPSSASDTAPGAIHYPNALAMTLSVCGRSWERDILNRQFSLAQIRTQSEGAPVVVDPTDSTPCPAAACSQNAVNLPCATVIYVRVGKDAYLGYELQGGP
jgi:hypothetical protein